MGLVRCFRYLSCLDLLVLLNEHTTARAFGVCHLAPFGLLTNDARQDTRKRTTYWPRSASDQTETASGQMGAEACFFFHSLLSLYPIDQLIDRKRGSSGSPGLPNMPNKSAL